MRSLVLVALLAVGVPDREDPKKKEVQPAQERLLGEWQVVKFVHGGADDIFGKKDMVLIFDKNEIHVREDGQLKPRDDASYVLRC